MGPLHLSFSPGRLLSEAELGLVKYFLLSGCLPCLVEVVCGWASI